ncbi:hypothetical protein KEJ32_01275 [Candidatus Bathyarchaeota archaeon]|nr:hypothetical protein [Candidatus Bathyarchaeota archaeon]
MGVKNEDLNKIVDEIRTFLKKEKIPEEYVINIYKDYVACCGYFPTGVVIEIEGPEEQPIKDLDLKIYAKIIEICERENIEYHECKPLSII